MTDDELPPLGSALQKLGARLADLLDDDQWNNVEQMLLDVYEEARSGFYSIEQDRARSVPGEEELMRLIDNYALEAADHVSDYAWSKGEARAALRAAIRQALCSVSEPEKFSSDDVLLLHSLLDQLIDSDLDLAERFIEARLARIALRKRLIPSDKEQQ